MPSKGEMRCIGDLACGYRGEKTRAPGVSKRRPQGAIEHERVLVVAGGG